MDESTELECLYSNVLQFEHELREQEGEYQSTPHIGDYIKTLISLDLMEGNTAPSVFDIIKGICEKETFTYIDKYWALNALMPDLDKIAIDLGALKRDSVIQTQEWTVNVSYESLSIETISHVEKYLDDTWIGNYMILDRHVEISKIKSLKHANLINECVNKIIEADKK
jgi:hypothetical protein